VCFPSNRGTSLKQASKQAKTTNEKLSVLENKILCFAKLEETRQRRGGAGRKTAFAKPEHGRGHAISPSTL